MAKCNNCGAKLGCSCKRRTASDGKSCCANCISKYEKGIKKVNTSTQDDINVAPSMIINATAIQKD
jgi:hypothetical protein